MAARGMWWMAVQTIGTRAISLAGQLALGWLLTPADIGLYALALSVSNAVGALRNGGVMQLFVRSPEDFRTLSGPLTGMAFFFNCLAAILVALLAPLAQIHFHSVALKWLLVCLGVSFPLGTLSVVYRSWLIIEGRYTDSTRLSVLSTLFWQVGTIGMAIAHCGAYSYVVPTALQGLLETAYGAWLMKGWPPVQLFLSRSLFLEIFRQTRWIMFGAAMLTLATTGDYLAVGWFNSSAMVGQYFFAFQLVSAVGTLLSTGIETVMPTLFARIDSYPSHMSSAVLEGSSLLMVLSWPVAGLLAFAAPPLVLALWGPKWAPAAQAIQIMAFCLPAWILKSLVRSIVEARGLWRSRSVLLTVYGIGAVTCAALGGATGSLLVVAGVVTAFYLSFSVGLLIFVGHLTASPLSLVARRILPPSLICGVAVLMSLPVAAGKVLILSLLQRSLLAIAVYLAVSVALNALALRSQWRNGLLLVRQVLPAGGTG